MSKYLKWSAMAVIMVAVIIAMAFAIPTSFDAYAEFEVDEHGTGWIPNDGSFPTSYSTEPLRSLQQLDSLSPSVDLSDSSNPAFPGIGDQGSYGSCAAYATTYYQFTYQVAILNNLNARDNKENVFSPIQLFNYLNYGDVNHGSSIELYYYLLSEIGAVRYSEFNTSSNSECQWNGKSKWFEITSDNENYTARERTVLALNRALKTRISAWNSEQFSLQDANTIVPVITTADKSCLNVIKNALANNHLLVFGLEDAYSIKHNLQYNGTKAYVPYFENVNGDGHALTIVGYDDSIYFDLNGNGTAEGFEYGAFKVANSWGTDWGSSGFFWMPYDTLNCVSNDSGLNVTNRIVPLYENRFYFIQVQNYNPELTVEVEVTLKDRKACQMHLERLKTNVEGSPLTFLNGFQWLGARGFDGTYYYSVTTDFNGNTAGYADYDSRVFVFDLSNPYYNHAFFSSSCTFYDDCSLYCLNVEDYGSSNTYTTTVENVEWKDSQGNVLLVNSPADVLDGTQKSYYYGGYVLDTSTVKMNQDARRVNFQVTVYYSTQKMVVHIGNRSYAVTLTGTTPLTTTINGDYLKVRKYPISTDNGTAYIWDYQIKLSQPTPVGSMEDFYIEYRKGSRYIPGRLYTDFVAYNSFVKTGLSTGMTAQDIIDDIKGNDTAYTYTPVNGITFDEIANPSTTSAGTGVIVLKEYNGKIAEVYYAVLFGDVTGGGTIGNGLIEVDDALMALRHVAQTGLITQEFFLIAADIDHDGDVDQSDTQAILSEASHMPTISQNYTITTVPDGLYYINTVEFV